MGFASGGDHLTLDSENLVLENWLKPLLVHDDTQYRLAIENSEGFKFSNNGTFTSTRHPACATGKFSTTLENKFNR